MDLLFVLAVGLLAGIVSGVIGTGSSLILLPVLVQAYGPKEAVPIMATAAIAANLSRVAAWWREVDWRAVGAYSLSGVPCAALGAHTLLMLPPRVVEFAIGSFFILMIPVRRWSDPGGGPGNLLHLALCGAAIGFLTGIVVSTGPLSVPVFLGYGLTRGAFIGTEAAGSISIYLAKSFTFQALGALPWPLVAKGLLVSSSLVIGAFVAKPFVLRLSPDHFGRVMEALMLCSGAALLWSAFTAA
jgi:uncharacterized membrane protein YfcA